MRLVIEPETRDSLSFLIGLFGIIEQTALVPFGVNPSVPLLTLFGAMIGLGVAPTIAGKRNGNGNGAKAPNGKGEANRSNGSEGKGNG